ncbi:MAG: MFS transporter [Dehalococcoidia bacterium]|nr:MFS transporter [Dehalococcoidia bacterium]
MALAGFNFGLFITPMGKDLGINRATFGWALSARQISAAATSPLLGRIVDRRGARLPLLLSTSVTVAAMCALPFIGAGWQLIALFTVVGLFGFAGPGALVIVVPVAKWFVRRRPLAMSIMSMGSPLGAVLFIPLSQAFIDGWGWRTSWIILAAMGAAIVLPLALLVRRQPEDMGLHPDGDAPGAQEATLHRAGVREVSYTVRQATRTLTFWQLVGVFALMNLAMSSVGLHRIPHFTDQGISARLVSFATSGDAIAAVAATIVAGRLMQRYAARYVGAAGLALIAVSILLTILADSVAMMFISMATFGLAAGSMIVLQNFLWADYFGRVHAGGVRGASMPVTLIFSAAGPPLAGYVYDFTGSYNPIWWVGIFLMLGGALLLLLTRPPDSGAAEYRLGGAALGAAE